MRNSLQYIRTRQKKIERMRRHTTKKHPNNRKKMNGADMSLRNNRKKTKRVPKKFCESITLPSDSRFIGNTESINELVNSIIVKAESGGDDFNRRFIFDLSNVTKLDEAMINLLLTVANYLEILGFDYGGNFPEDEECRTMLEISGFFDHVKTNVQIKSAQDTIFTISGDDKTNDQAIGAQIKKITKALTGVEDTFQPLYTTLGEIAANSVEHANADKDKKNWFMSVHYEQSRVLIMMADIGSGILKTMNLRWKQELLNELWNEAPSDILKNMFAGKYQSSTREKNRNNGLPDMVPRVQSNYLNNIIVVSNNAIYDFSGNSTRTLNNSFPGTFYLIEVTAENINVWQNRLK